METCPHEARFELTVLHSALLLAEKNYCDSLTTYKESVRNVFIPVVHAFKEVSHGFSGSDLPDKSLKIMRHCVNRLINLVPHFQLSLGNDEMEYIYATWPKINAQFLFDVLNEADGFVPFLQVLTSLPIAKQEIIIPEILKNVQLTALIAAILEYLLLFENQVMLQYAFNLQCSSQSNTLKSAHSCHKFVIEVVTLVSRMLQNQTMFVSGKNSYTAKLIFVLTHLLGSLIMLDYSEKIYCFKSLCFMCDLDCKVNAQTSDNNSSSAAFDRYCISLNKCDDEMCCRLFKRTEFRDIFLTPVKYSLNMVTISNELLLEFSVSLQNLASQFNMQECSYKWYEEIPLLSIPHQCRGPLYSHLLDTVVTCERICTKYRAFDEICTSWTSLHQKLVKLNYSASSFADVNEFCDSCFIVCQNLPGAKERSLWLCNMERDVDENIEIEFLKCLEINLGAFLSPNHFLAILKQLNQAISQQRLSEILIKLYRCLPVSARNETLAATFKMFSSLSTLISNNYSLVSSAPAAMMICFNKMLNSEVQIGLLVEELSMYAIVVPNLVVERVVSDLFHSQQQAELMAKVCLELWPLTCYSVNGNESSYCFDLINEELKKSDLAAKETKNCLVFLKFILCNYDASKHHHCLRPFTILWNCGLPLINNWNNLTVVSLDVILVGLDIVNLFVSTVGFSPDNYCEKCPRIVLVGMLLSIINATTVYSCYVLPEDYVKFYSNIFSIRDKCIGILNFLLSMATVSSELLLDRELRWLQKILHCFNWSTRLLLLRWKVFTVDKLFLPHPVKAFLNFSSQPVEMLLYDNRGCLVALLECCKVFEASFEPRLSCHLEEYLIHNLPLVVSTLSTILPCSSMVEWKNLASHCHFSKQFYGKFDKITKMSVYLETNAVRASTLILMSLLNIAELQKYSNPHCVQMITCYCEILQLFLAKSTNKEKLGKSDIFELIIILRDAVTCMMLISERLSNNLRIFIMELINILNQNKEILFAEQVAFQECSIKYISNCIKHIQDEDIIKLWML